MALDEESAKPEQWEGFVGASGSFVSWISLPKSFHLVSLIINTTNYRDKWALM